MISGGHTALYRIPEAGAARLLGETRDDAVGEAFDKVAKLLGLAYPGGPAVARAARRAGTRRPSIFRARSRESRGLDFSFSGLKTAVALEVERQRARGPLGARQLADLAASFEQAAVDVLVARARRALAAEAGRPRRLAVVGGVAANRRLRAAFEAAAREDGFEVIFPPLALCTDNAAMIAAAGAKQLAARRAPRARARLLLARPDGGGALGAAGCGVNAASVRAVLARHGLLARRDLGQNFLVDDAMAARLVRARGCRAGRDA